MGLSSIKTSTIFSIYAFSQCNQDSSSFSCPFLSMKYCTPIYSDKLRLCMGLGNAPQLSMSTKCKTNAPAGTGKARAGRGRARTHEGHAQGKARHAQARARYAHTTGFLSTCWFVLQDKQHRKARATRSKARTHRGYGQNQGLNCLKIKSSTWFAMEGLGPLTSLARVCIPRIFFGFRFL